MTESNHVTLAIESAIAGGSISLQKNGVEIANWIGSSNVSKAEDLLVNIDVILRSTDISKHDIDLIAVSAGPGSFTGIRIGLATALGFKNGLGVTMSSVSAMHAIASEHSAHEETVIAVPMGRNAVCMQRFNITANRADAIDEPHTISDTHLTEYVEAAVNINILLHPVLAERFEPSERITNIGANIAFAVGRLCSKTPGIVAEPLFISKSF